MAYTWFGEICYCCSQTSLPEPAWQCLSHFANHFFEPCSEFSLIPLSGEEMQMKEGNSPPFSAPKNLEGPSQLALHGLQDSWSSRSFLSRRVGVPNHVDRLLYELILYQELIDAHTESILMCVPKFYNLYRNTQFKFFKNCLSTTSLRYSS